MREKPTNEKKQIFRHILSGIPAKGYRGQKAEGKKQESPATLQAQQPIIRRTGYGSYEGL